MTAAEAHYRAGPAMTAPRTRKHRGNMQTEWEESPSAVDPDFRRYVTEHGVIATVSRDSAGWRLVLWAECGRVDAHAAAMDAGNRFADAVDVALAAEGWSAPDRGTV